ncbi:MAG: amino acid ABC transporter permease, partial [Clostridia bacterium]
MSFFEWVWRILKENYTFLLQGIGFTMLMALVGTFIGFAIGLGVAIVRTIPTEENSSKIKKILLGAIKAIFTAYIEIFRGTPMIVQSVVIYYGLQGAGVAIDPLVAAILIISVNTGAYMAEIIRGGIISVDNGQTEGAHSIGMTHWQTMTKVVLPQAIRNIMPSVGNEFVVNI